MHVFNENNQQHKNPDLPHKMNLIQIFTTFAVKRAKEKEKKKQNKQNKITKYLQMSHLVIVNANGQVNFNCNLF